MSKNYFLYYAVVSKKRLIEPDDAETSAHNYMAYQFVVATPPLASMVEAEKWCNWYEKSYREPKDV